MQMSRDIQTSRFPGFLVPVLAVLALVAISMVGCSKRGDVKLQLMVDSTGALCAAESMGRGIRMLRWDNTARRWVPLFTVSDGMERVAALPGERFVFVTGESWNLPTDLAVYSANGVKVSTLSTGYLDSSPQLFDKELVLFMRSAGIRDYSMGGHVRDTFTPYNADLSSGNAEKVPGIPTLSRYDAAVATSNGGFVILNRSLHRTQELTLYELNSGSESKVRIEQPISAIESALAQDGKVYLLCSEGSGASWRVFVIEIDVAKGHGKTIRTVYKGQGYVESACFGDSADLAYVQVKRPFFASEIREIFRVRGERTEKLPMP